VRRPAVRRRHGEAVGAAIGASDAIARPFTAPRRRRPLFVSVVVLVISVLFVSVLLISIQPRSFLQPHFVGLLLAVRIGLEPGRYHLQ
jgi:hypothetical protein